ncbi:ribonuclease H-like YkuK family protein [Alicyclobacillus fastidiosus]|uniref:Ribonuclease H-like YkuK family protein n=1 Tax=Alicyclobacillus fastidiosus TaxID=392011 RepID=A0ABV5AE48_9BACL|nr:ribonuclease H-like YkuK family protein [Alicyclobacillus fastidiosus]WEH09919.1 ribonuclease H-like YkuK family protein [Alicyclobacillus fastidiosus]
MRFRSPTRGLLSLEDVAADILHERAANPGADYRLIIGTDSQLRGNGTTATFVTAIILHKTGHGARYFVRKFVHEHLYSLRQRMFTEAALSIQTSGLLMEYLQVDSHDPTPPNQASSPDWHIEVHLDIGERGETKQWIREIVAWIEANGYEARIKPNSYGASTVADRYTKH